MIVAIIVIFILLVITFILTVKYKDMFVTKALPPSQQDQTDQFNNEQTDQSNNDQNTGEGTDWVWQVKARSANRSAI